ncbi:MAG: DegT/DnrJ/EryC1/StrS family aminotransferase [Nitrospirae bacterium]|nr:MAG: DegT/DnrJ/EryC1/StrS family aminotransferase [Nitrospirota bacterium]
MKKIAVAQPIIEEQEISNVLKALHDGAISGFYGVYIELFEKNFAEYCGCSHAVAVSSGTAALHIALAAIGVKQGDEVIVATMTNMATFFAVHYLGAVPVPIDIEADTLNINPLLIEDKITTKTKAVIVVHLFGHPVDMDPVNKIACKHNLFVIEDCAEAHGAQYKGKKVGGLGSIGCFSFYANKIITTGEGGMCTTNDPVIANKISSLKSLAFGKSNKFMHSDIGFNYRMTNIQAAIGCAQLEKISDIIDMKRSMAHKYNALLHDCDYLQLPDEKPYARNVYWMYHVVLRGNVSERRSEIMRSLALEGIETRETFIPYNLQENLPLNPSIKKDDCPVANDVAYKGFYLPSGPIIKDDDIAYIADKLKKIISSTVA